MQISAVYNKDIMSNMETMSTQLSQKSNIFYLFLENQIVVISVTIPMLICILNFTYIRLTYMWV